MSAGVDIDFIQGKQGNRTFDYDVAITGSSSNTISFATDAVPDDLAAGDYIAVAQQSPVVQLPDDAFSLLETRLAHRILKSIGDYDGARNLDGDIAAEEKALKALLEPRIEGEPQVLINRQSLLRGRRFMPRRGLFYVVPFVLSLSQLIMNSSSWLT